MGMIYFAGLLDDRTRAVLSHGEDPAYTNPICIRGYDEVGNLLSKIRCDNPVPIVQVSLAVGVTGLLDQYRFYFHARDRHGDSVVAYQWLTDSQSQNGTITPWLACVPTRIAVNPEGEVFGFFSLGESAVNNSAKIDNGNTNVFITAVTAVYVEPFRIYNRDGFRMPAPDIFAEPVTFEIDEGNNFLMGGFARTLNGYEYIDFYNYWNPSASPPGSGYGQMGMASHVFRKYDRAGNLLWAIPGYSDVYEWYQDAFGEWRAGRLQNATDCVLSTAWDSSGYLYLAGVSRHFPQETPSSPGNRWYRAPGYQARVRKIDPADGSVIWDHFFAHTHITGPLSSGPEWTNLVIDDDVLFLVFRHRIFKIDTDGETIADVPRAFSSGVNSFGEYQPISPVPNATHVFGGKLHVTTFWSNANPLNLQIYNLANLTLIERRTHKKEKSNQPERILNDTKYVGERQTFPIPGYFTGGDAFSVWHYLAEDESGDQKWAEENIGTPGLHGRVARDDDGFNYYSHTGTPLGAWPNTGSILVTIDDTPQYLTRLQYYEQILRFTDAYGRQVGPDGSGDAWVTHDIGAVPDTALNSIALPLRLQAPFFEGDRYAAPPGLPLRLGVAVQRWMLEPIIKGAAQTFYRVRIDGDPILYLNPSFFSVRSSADADTALSVTCPAVGSDALAILNERTGAVMRLQTGFRQGDHPVQYTDYLIATLGRIRGDRGARARSISMDGSAPALPVAGRRREVYGLSYRRATAAGAQTWRVIPDPYMNPGDVAIWGSEEITATQITVSVSTTQATMEISEAAD